MTPVLLHDSLPSRLRIMLEPHHPLCREDFIWFLEYIKKNTVEENSALSELPQPRLLKHFECFAEIALMIIHRRNEPQEGMERIRKYIHQAAADIQIYS